MLTSHFLPHDFIVGYKQTCADDETNQPFQFHVTGGHASQDPGNTVQRPRAKHVSAAAQ